MADSTPDNAAETAHDSPQAANATEAEGSPVPDVAAILAALKRDDRDTATGRFRPGHVRNLTHGRRAPHLWEASPLAGLLAERRAAVETDLGGVENLSAIETGLAREYSRLDLLVEAAGERLIRDGLETTSGKTRAAASLWLALLDRQARLAGQLGLQRRARPTASITDWAREAKS